MREGGMPTFSAAEYSRRWAAVDELLERQRLDGLVVFGTAGSDPGAQYLSGWPTTREAWLVYRPTQPPTLFVQLYNHWPNARRLSILDDVRWGGQSSPRAVAEQLRALGLQRARIGLVGPMSFQHHGELWSALPEASFVDVTPAIVRLRMIKSPEEIVWMRRGAELSDLGIAALVREARPGMTETELGAIIEEAYIRAGGQNYIHYLGVTPMAEPSLCVPGQRPSDRRLTAGDVLFVEISAHYWSYVGQILRTFAVAADPPALYQRLHATAEEAFDRIIAMLRDGGTAAEVVEAASVIEAAGFTVFDDLLHGFGGGYLPPVLRSRSSLHGPVPDFTLRTGMTIVVQPNVITPDERAGVQVGELVLITQTGVERLHGFERGFLRIGG